MSKLLATCVGAALMMLAGCAYEYQSWPYGYYVGAPIWYDDYYGPYYDGYWGPDGFFYYSEGAGHPFRADMSGHFRREAFSGGHRVTRGGMGGGMGGMGGAGHRS
jgi:hypothetical protein